MKKITILLMLILALANISRTRAGDLKEMKAFHSIVVSSEIIAELVLSKEEAIEPAFKIASNDDLIAEVVDSVLRLRMKTGRYEDGDLKVRIHYTRDPKMLEANDRAQIWSEEDLYLDGDLTVKLYNGGEMRFRLFCDSLNATLSQGSVIYLTGKTRALQVKVSTNATFSGYEFESQYAFATASSTGKAKLSVSKSLDANASTKGFIGYVGDPPRVKEKTSLGGEILETTLEE